MGEQVEESLEPFGEEGDKSLVPCSKRSWFGPKKLLFIFCVINLLNYVDRGIIGSNGVNGSPRICKDGVCIPGTGIHYSPFRLLGIGLSVWTAITALCGVSFNFWTIAICRMLVGVGEASFISLAPPCIVDVAPVARKTAWLGTFFMCIPAGVAFGYVLGGLIGAHFSWRWAFYGEAIIMLPWAILCFFVKHVGLKGTKPELTMEPEVMLSHEVEGKQVSRGTAESSAKTEVLSLPISTNISLPKEEIKPLNFFAVYWNDLKILFDRVYVVNILGYVSYNFVMGAYSYWGPKAGYGIYHMKNPDTLFGVITFICGILGTLAGGYLLDRINSTIKNAFKVLSGATLLGAILCFSAFWSRNLYLFVALFSSGELLIFFAQAPANYICLHCVNPSLRPLSMALCTIAIHIFGYVPSAPLLGVTQDYIKNWRTTCICFTSLLFVPAIVWFIGTFLHSVDKYTEHCDRPVSAVEKSSQTPFTDESRSKIRKDG